MGSGLGPLFWGDWGQRSMVCGSSRWAPVRAIQMEHLGVDECNVESPKWYWARAVQMGQLEMEGE